MKKFVAFVIFCSTVGLPVLAEDAVIKNDHVEESVCNNALCTCNPCLCELCDCQKNELKEDSLDEALRSCSEEGCSHDERNDKIQQ